MNLPWILDSDNAIESLQYSQVAAKLFPFISFTGEEKNKNNIKLSQSASKQTDLCAKLRLRSAWESALVFIKVEEGLGS